MAKDNEFYKQLYDDIGKRAISIKMGIERFYPKSSYINRTVGETVLAVMERINPTAVDHKKKLHMLADTLRSLSYQINKLRVEIAKQLVDEDEDKGKKA